MWRTILDRIIEAVMIIGFIVSICVWVIVSIATIWNG